MWTGCRAVACITVACCNEHLSFGFAASLYQGGILGTDLGGFGKDRGWGRGGSGNVLEKS